MIIMINMMKIILLNTNYIFLKVEQVYMNINKISNYSTIVYSI